MRALLLVVLVAIVIAAPSVVARDPPRPPDIVYRDVQSACDVDGDGEGDLFVNNLTLRSPPHHADARSEVEVVSGATGASLWKVDNLYAGTMPVPDSVPYAARGQALPGSNPTMQRAGDLDGDGTCDVLVHGLDSLAGYSTPFVGEPSIQNYRLTLRALSGSDGSEIWRIELDASTTSASDPVFGTSSNVVTRGFPTAVVLVDAPSGPRVVTKLTDLRYHFGDMPIEVEVPGVQPSRSTLKGPLHAEDVRITERVQMRDATTGDLLWERVFGSESPSADIDSRFTNLTWIGDARDLNGDGEPDLVLDQLLVATPRTTEANQPATGDTMFRHGRGARVAALDGTTGATLWETLTRDPLAAQANVAAEENFETLAWTRAQPSGDIDGDGVPEVLATYVAQEESLATTLEGAYRTHFIPLSGATGAPLWDVRQQGWGVARPLDLEETTTRIGLGILDVPAAASTEGPFPPKFVRLLALDAASGESLWSEERAFAQNSFLSYNLALAQHQEALAPHDWNNDGLRDLVSAAQPTARTDRDQVLLATSSHVYEIRSGADGSLLASITAWGPDGRVVRCAGAEDKLTVVSGHARRLEIARFDPTAGTREWRQVLHNDPTPRAATSAMDTTALGVTCAGGEAGSFVGLDLQAYSFDRGHEVVPVLASLDADGAPRWMTPTLRGTPPADAMFQASLADHAPATGALVGAALVGVAIGGLAAVATIALLARRGSRLLAVAIVLLLLAPGAVGLALTGPAARGPATVAAPDPIAAAIDPQAISSVTSPARAPDLAAAVAAARARVLGADDPARFTNEETLSFSYGVGDVNEDGFEDLVLDQFCMGGDPCFDGTRLPEDAADFAVSKNCGAPHDLVAVNGANGSMLWSLDLGVDGPINQCGENIVIGTFPTSQGIAILVYRFQIIWATGFNLDGVSLSDYSAILAKDGSTLWTYSVKGAYGADFTMTQFGRDYVLIPLLRDGALFLQSVGWTTSTSSTIFPVLPIYPVTDDHVTPHDVYQPVEWAARLDLETGTEVWKHDTFQPAPGPNRWPRLPAENLDYAWSYSYYEKGLEYWSSRGCCGDLTGDGEPDLIFDVTEWTPTPAASASGVDVRLVVYDGVTGELHMDRYVAEDLPMRRGEDSFRTSYSLVPAFVGSVPSPILLEPLGDADGDGADDVLLHVYTRAPEFRQDMSVLSGATGETLWTLSSIRDLRALVLGDADGDGGEDFLLLDWYGHEAGAEKMDDYVTPAEVPLTLVSGRTGERIWRASTYAAPSDVVESFRTIARNGRVDVDADGVGDFFADDPIYLDDQTVVHQMRVLSGRDGSTLRTMRTVGAFSIGSGAGDLDEDGRGEIAILSGDVNDLWVTAYDGASGEPEWSRRVSALPASGYTEALPKLRLHALARPGHDALLVTFHMQLTRTATGLGFCIGCTNEAEFGEYTYTYRSLTSQMMSVEGDDGALEWALPTLLPADGAARVIGATPGALAFDRIAERASAIGLAGSAAREARPYALPVAGAFALAYVTMLAGGIAIVRFRSRFEGVPELD